MVLILLLAPVLLEPVDQLLEGRVVLLVEVEAARPHLYELFNHALFWNVAEHDILRVVWQDGKPVGDASWVVLLLLFEFELELLVSFHVGELGVAAYLTHEAVARDDVPLNNLVEALKVGLVADLEAIADDCALLLVNLRDVNVHEMAMLPEPPGQGDAILTARRWTEEELSLAIL